MRCIRNPGPVSEALGVSKLTPHPSLQDRANSLKVSEDELIGDTDSQSGFVRDVFQEGSQDCAPLTVRMLLSLS